MNKINNFHINIFGKDYIIRKFSTIIINNISYLFIGYVYNNDIIPDINCLYINNDNKIVRRYVNKDNFKTYIQFEVNGDPKGKGRPRFARMGKFVRTYTDSKTVSVETSISNAFKRIKNKFDIAKDTKVHIDIECHMPIPKSISNKKRLSLINTDHMKKPDIDNLCKSVLDALNGEAYVDDSLISKLTCRKIYSLQPRTIIKINY